MTMGNVVTEFQRSLDEIRQQGVEQGREQGIEQGREQGIEQGREQGQVAVLVQLVARKFGQGTAEEVQQLIVGRPGRDRLRHTGGVPGARAGGLKGIFGRWGDRDARVTEKEG